LKDKTIIVTSSATGIGQAFSIAVSSYGTKIVVADMNPGDKTVQLIKSAGGEAIYTKVDVRDEESKKSMAKAAIDWTERIDGLINNADYFREV
jgi:NAD(P)-dependent dehydrogenase (short-subunit alcohol dehydrogenase family)|tara:strand:- start:47 stop:325 length:279 start_codon:yes stop_codon:yes gene_type:complete